MNLRGVTKTQGIATPDWYTPVTNKLLREITQTIVQAVRPSKIILFGSYAYGSPNIHSDIDLLIITNALTEKSALARAREISTLFPQRQYGLDIVVRTPREIKECLIQEDDFIREILEKGTILYERQHRRSVGPRSRRGLQKRARSRPSSKRART